MISIAAAITIPVTNAVKQENTSKSLRTTLMAAASPCGPWSKRRAHLYRGGKVIEWNFGVAFADPNNRVSQFGGGFMRGDRIAPTDTSSRWPTRGQMINASTSMMPMPITSTASARGS